MGIPDYLGEIIVDEVAVVENLEKIADSNKEEKVSGTYRVDIVVLVKV